MTAPRSSAFNPYVHGSRGFFSAMVFVYHVANSGLPTFVAVERSWVAAQMLASLKFGVELFFGISGYVIVGALGRSESLRAFLWDRATRIYPVLWLTLIAITVGAHLGHLWRPPLGQWLLNFLAPPPFIPIGQINPAAWSLGYELTFYFIAGLCWWLKMNGRRSWLPIAVLLGVALIVLFPRAILIPAGIGIALGLGERRGVRRWTGAPLLALVTFLLLWRWVDLSSGDVQLFSPTRHGVGAWLAAMPAMLLAGAAGALALAGIAGGRGWLGRLMNTAVLRWLGTISYSFYLWHPVVMGATKMALLKAGAPAALGPWSQTAFALVTLPPALLVSHLSQQWVEIRLTRWLRRHGPAEDKGQVPITALADRYGDKPRAGGRL